MDQRRHNVQLVFQREMTGVEKVKFGIRQVSKIWPCAISRENLVVLAPHDQCWRLMFTEKGMEFRIERDVSTVIVEQIQLDVFIARTIQQHLVMEPVIRVDTRQIVDSIGVLELRR